MKILIFLLFLFSSAILFAQQNYIEYHKKIIQAEKLIIATDMKASLVKYKKTFDEYPKAFARDAFLAFQIACMVKDTAYISYFFEKSVSNGIIWEAINYSEYYRGVVDYDRDYKKRLENLYIVARRKYETSIDTNIRKFVLSLLENDDMKRRKDGNEVKDSLDIVNWLKVMDNNGKILDSLIKKVGFPGEHAAGIFNSEVVIVRGGKSKIYPTGINLYTAPSRIFYHNACTFQYTKEHLLKAIKDGELTPKEYALLHEWSFNTLLRKSNWWDKYYTYDCVRPSEKLKSYNFFLDKFTYSKDINFINGCREEIGMCTVEHEKKLNDFGAENKLFVKFGFNGWF